MNKVVFLILSMISFSSIALSQDPDQDEEVPKKPYEVFIECQKISTEQYNKSMDLCSKRWKTSNKERCAERVERIFETAMKRCDRLIEKCDNW